MNNISFLSEKFKFYTDKYWVIGILALFLLIGTNYTVSGQDCSTFSPGTIKIKDGYNNICAGDSPKLESVSKASGDNGSYAYIWQWSKDGNEWESIIKPGPPYFYPEAPDNMLSFDESVKTIYIRRGVIDGVCNTFSNTLTITVLGKNMNVLPPGATQTVCSKGEVKTVKLDPAADVERKWTVSGDWDKILPEEMDESGEGDFPGFIAKENLSDAPYTATVHVTIGGCPSTEKTFTITVNPKPTVNVDSPTVCSGVTVDDIPFTSSITGVTLEYEWIVNNDYDKILPAGIQSGEGDDYFPGFTAPKNTSGEPYTATITVTPKIGDCSGDSKEFTITVNPEPKVNNIENIIACNDENVSVDITGTAIKYGMEIISSDISDINFITQEIPANSDGSAKHDFGDMTNTGTSPQNAVIEITPYDVCDGGGKSEQFTITVNPEPTVDNVNAKSQIVYSGEQVSKVEFTSPVADVEYEWTVSGDWNEILPDEIEKSGNGTFPAFTVRENISGKSYTATITVTPKIGDCSGEPEMFTITVLPASAESPEIIESIIDTTYCVCEKEISCELSVEPVGIFPYKYQWYFNEVPSIENGQAIDDATEKIYYTPAGLPVGKYYYYCKVYGSEPIYSRISTVTVIPDDAKIGKLLINSKEVHVEISDGEVEYMAPCNEDCTENCTEDIILAVAALSKYAEVSINVDGEEYKDVENVEIPLVLVKDITKIAVNIVPCDGGASKTYIFNVAKAVENVIFQRWHNSLALYRNAEENGGYTDLRGVRWYKNGKLIIEQKEDDMNAVVTSLDNPKEWFIHLLPGEEVAIYHAEVNIAGNWHKVCGVPVQNEELRKTGVYPNPVESGGNVTVELPFVPEKGRMEIMTLSGITVKKDIPLSSNINYVNIDGLSSGIYVLRITDTSGNVTSVVETIRLIVK